MLSLKARCLSISSLSAWKCQHCQLLLFSPDIILSWHRCLGNVVKAKVKIRIKKRHRSGFWQKVKKCVFLECFYFFFKFVTKFLKCHCYKNCHSFATTEPLSLKAGAGAFSPAPAPRPQHWQTQSFSFIFSPFSYSPWRLK